MKRYVDKTYYLTNLVSLLSVTHHKASESEVGSYVGCDDMQFRWSIKLLEIMTVVET